MGAWPSHGSLAAAVSVWIPILNLVRPYRIVREVTALLSEGAPGPQLVILIWWVVSVVSADDIAMFYEQQQDPEAAWMVAFTRQDAADRDAFETHWRRILSDDSVVARTVLADGRVAGNLLKFDTHGQPEVGYWIGREWWGRGVATAALRAFLIEIDERPLYGVVARDNAASIRVLEKCGFIVVGQDRAFAHARDVEVDQVVLRLDHGGSRSLDAAGPATEA